MIKNNFKNPIFDGADPCILFYEGKYYIYFTTETDRDIGDDNAFLTETAEGDGILVCCSTDLKNWENLGYALKKGDVIGEDRFWSPDVISHKGKFYMVYAAEEHIAVAVADNPAGPFVQKEKKWLMERKAIDGRIFVDDDGVAYLYYVRLGNQIYVAKMKTNLLEIEEEYDDWLIYAQDAWELVDCTVAEGPCMLKHKGKYYLSYSANHTRNENYAVGYATADNPLGPFKKYEGNPILSKKGKIVGVGGHSFVRLSDGTLICAYHCHSGNPDNFRPRKCCLNTAKFVERENGEDIIVIDGPYSEK